ncbi:hypothetical protein NL676_005008 [Syzygium grande]|nr:hypothetical protein NL676_005008 [Syzygium grande]
MSSFSPLDDGSVLSPGFEPYAAHHFAEPGSAAEDDSDGGLAPGGGFFPEQAPAAGSSRRRRTARGPTGRMARLCRIRWRCSLRKNSL